MKKQTLTLATLAVVTFGWISVAAAQDPGEGRMRRGGPGFGQGGHGGPGGPPAGRIAERLELTAEQKEQWKAIHEKARETGEPLMKAQGEAKRAFHQALEAENADPGVVGQAALAMRATQRNAENHRKATFESVKAILTPEQIAKMESRERRGGPKGQRGPGRKHHQPQASN